MFDLRKTTKDFLKLLRSMESGEEPQVLVVYLEDGTKLVLKIEAVEVKPNLKLLKIDQA